MKGLLNTDLAFSRNNYQDLWSAADEIWYCVLVRNLISAVSDLPGCRASRQRQHQAERDSNDRDHVRATQGESDARIGEATEAGGT